MTDIALKGWTSPERDTVLHAFARALERCPDKTLLDFSGETYSYREVDRQATCFAHVLASLGAKAGETVTTLLDNNFDTVLVWLAANKIGAIYVPLNTALRGDFLRHQLADAASSVLICERDYAERLSSIQDSLPDLKHVLHRGDALDLSLQAISVGRLDENRGDDDTPFTTLPDPSSVSCIIYTSGTTGPSKGCMMSFNYQVNLARQQLAATPATEDDIQFTPLPLFHANAINVGVLTTILVGGTVAIAPRFSVSNFWPEVERTGATIVSILGSMGSLLAQAEGSESTKRCFGQVHTVRGAPFTPEVMQTWKTRFGVRNIGSNGYGLSEAAYVTSLPGGVPCPPGSSGKRFGDFDVRIFDDEDRELPPNVAGEIVVRPLKPHIMFEGYWRRPADTLRIMRNMWLHTGDIGKFDEDGFFYFVDRKKDYLRRRGENISSFEMETTFESHPDVEEAAVHAVFSEFGEDDVKLTAVLKENATITEKKLCVWCLDRVPYYAVPRYIEFRKELPKSPMGKVYKYKLRDEGKTPATWDLEESDVKVTKR